MSLCVMSRNEAHAQTTHQVEKIYTRPEHQCMIYQNVKQCSSSNHFHVFEPQFLESLSLSAPVISRESRPMTIKLELDLYNFAFHAVLYWNSLQIELRQCASMDDFRSSLEGIKSIIG